MTVEEAVEEARAAIRSKRQSLAFAAPEMAELHWRELEESVESVIERLAAEQ